MCGPRTMISLRARRDVLVMLEVDDAHLEVRHRQPRRVEATPVGVVDRIAVQPGHLGGAVGTQPADPRAFGDPVGDVLGDRVAAHIM